MDLEVKNYIDRLNEELPRLLRWRKEILDQIDIDKELPGWQVAEKYHQIISSLNKTIEDLKRENQELKKGPGDVTEINAYKKRLENEFNQLLSDRTEIMINIEDKKDKLNKIDDVRLEILRDLNNQIMNSQLSLEEIKSAKEDFVVSLSAKEKTLALKENELAGRDKELTGRDSELNRKEKDIIEQSEVLSKEKSNIAFEKKSLELDRQEIEQQIVNINANRTTTQKLYADRIAKLNELNDQLTSLNKKEKVLLFREEAMDKRSIELDKKRSRIKDIELKEKMLPIKEKELSAKEKSLAIKESLLDKEKRGVADGKQKILDKMIETGKMLTKISQEREGMKLEVIKAKEIIKKAKDKQSEIYHQSQAIIDRHNLLLLDEKRFKEKAVELDEKTRFSLLAYFLSFPIFLHIISRNLSPKHPHQLSLLLPPKKNRLA